MSGGADGKQYGDVCAKLSVFDLIPTAAAFVILGCLSLTGYNYSNSNQHREDINVYLEHDELIKTVNHQLG